MQGCDYSGWRPSGQSDLDGYDFVCRYLSNSSWKNLTFAEARQLTSWGKLVVSNWESTGTGGNFQQGVADAQTAKQQAAAAGMPVGFPVYFSVDEDVPPATQAEYFRGIGSVLTVPEIGVYGSADMVQYMVGQGLAKYGWRTMSTGWSGGASTQDCQLVQTGGNDNMDFDEAIAADFGGWNLNSTPSVGVDPTPTVPTPTATVVSEEEIMQIDPKSQNPNGQAFALNGKQTTMSLVADGFGATTSVRFAFWVGKNVAVLDLVLGGGSVGHTLPEGCTGVTVTRNDDANIPVGVSFS